jgi:hypothetical protein
MGSKLRALFPLRLPIAYSATSTTGFLRMSPLAMCPIVGTNGDLTTGALGPIAGEAPITVALFAKPSAHRRNVSVFAGISVAARTMRHGSMTCSHSIAAKHVLSVGHGPTVEGVATPARSVVTDEMIEFVPLGDGANENPVGSAVCICPLSLVPALTVALSRSVSTEDPAFVFAVSVLRDGALQGGEPYHVYNLARVGS